MEPGNSKMIQITIDVAELRGIFLKYGPSAIDGVLENYATVVKAKIRSALKLGELTGIPKPLVEEVK